MIRLVRLVMVAAIVLAGTTAAGAPAPVDHSYRVGDGCPETLEEAQELARAHGFPEPLAFACLESRSDVPSWRRFTPPG